MNLDQRFYLRDEDRPALRDAQPPPDMDERDPAGCSIFLVPLAIFVIGGMCWLMF